ncbi:MAG: hydantoinase B/oxoprolinase family protein, partial [Roseovarius sp.]|nr:hydantoinase B/oxoprolinase family protein [Roseovarius sp.]
MGLAEIRAMRETQMDAPLAAADEARRALDRLAGEARAEVAGQGVRDIAIERRAHLRYDGAYQPLEVPFGTKDEMQADFEAAHRQRYGFHSPERAIVFDMLSVEAIGQTGEAPQAVLPSGDGKPLARVPVYLEGARREVPLFARDRLDPAACVAGPAIVTEATGTTVIEPGWRAAIDAMGNLSLERTEARPHEHAAGTDADPVLLEVFNNLFMSVAEQMGVTLEKTSASVNIKERLDFSCAVFDSEGDLVANAPHVPVHLGSMSDSIKTVMRLNPDAAPGDAFVLNSPFRGGTHLPDVTVVTPVFIGGAPVFWLGSRGHHADIGGRTPGSAPPDSAHIDDEGVLIDNFKLVAGGRLREAEIGALLASGRYPCRNPAQNMADLKAQIAANETGRQEMLKVVDQFGLDVVRAYMGHVQDNAEESVRRVIDRLRDGRFSYRMDHGATIEVAVGVDAASRSARIDFTGTSAQHRGNYNAPKSVCRAVVLYVFRTMVGADIPLNEGCLKPLEIVIPEGSMLNPVHPAAVIAGNTEVSQAACNALYGALGVIAGSQATMNNFVWGNDEFQNYETIAGGTGAGPGFDGCDAVQSHMTNTRMTDPEILEKRFPVRLEEFAIRAGSGGAGRWRGGNGLIRRLRFLAPVTVTTLANHRIVPPFGAEGGEPGKVGRDWAELPDGTRREMAGNDEIDLPAGSVFGMETPGGGGWGAPR